MDESRPLADIEFCAFDLETTGWASQIRMVEIGATRFRLESEDGFFDTLVNPGVSISPTVIGIHGITDEMVRDAPRAPQALEAFFEFAEGCVLMAHNAPFDTTVVSRELTRHDLDIPDFLVVDTLSLARCHILGQPNYQLATLTDWLGRYAHAGFTDAVAAREVFRDAVKSIEGWESLPLASLEGAALRGAFERFQPEEVRLPPGLELLREAMGKERAVLVVYLGGSLGPAPRLLTPQWLYGSNGCGYLVAYCHQSCIVKSYRIDRIAEVLEP